MRTKLIPALLILLTIGWTGCKKDKGSDIRDTFIGTFSVTESWTENSKTLTKPPFTMSVEKSSVNSTTLLLNNFADYGAGVTVEATVSGKMLTIPQQTLPNSKSIIGTGTLADPAITFLYTENYNGNSIDVTVTANRK